MSRTPGRAAAPALAWTLALALARSAGAQTPAGSPAPAPPPAPAPAPPRPPADSGPVLRLDAPGLELSGRPVRLDAPWGDPLIVLDPKGEGRTGVPLRQVQRVDVRMHEGKASAGRGARIGFYVGAVPSAALITAAVISDERCGRSADDYFCGLATGASVIAGFLFTGITTGVGAVIGHYQQDGQWQPVWSPTRTGLRAAPVVVPTGPRRGVGLALGGRF